MIEKKSRAKNGHGYTYPYHNGFRTVIRAQGRVITAMGRSRTESRNKAKEKIKKLTPYNTGKNAMGGKTTLGDFLPAWLMGEHRHSITNSTLERYMSLADHHIIPLLGKWPLQEITKYHVNEMLSAMSERGQSARSQRQARAVLSVALNAAVVNELITLNPATHSRKIRVNNFEFTPLTGQEAQTALDSTKGDFLHLRWRLALLYGLRQGEVLGLRWRDIDFTISAMKVVHQVQTINGKRVFTELKTTSSRRTLPLDGESLALFRSHKVEVLKRKLFAGAKWEDHDLVFPNATGSPMQSRWDNTLWGRMLKNAKIPHRRLHDARHTSATLLYEKGHDIEVIRRFLGHSSVELTSKTYIHNSDRPLREVALNIGNLG